MRIVTSQKLFDKYPGKQIELMTLLTAITPNVDILPLGDYPTIKLHCDKILNESILLVGNDDVVAFSRLNNPATDPDQEVLSDQPYISTTDPTYLIPDKGRSIGRIPDEMGTPTFDYLSVVLKNQTEWLKTKPTSTGWFGLVNQAWSGIGQYMKNQFQIDNYKIAPPADSNNILINDTIKRYSLINLHGAQQTPYYYSQNGNSYPIALSPSSGNFKGCLSWTDACYGNYVIGRTKQMSIPMQAMYDGAFSFTGSTSVAYGPASAPAMAADLLFECYMKLILAGNTTIGEALNNAKQEFATQSIKQFGSLNGAMRKTLIQFYLMGVPDLKV